MNDRFKFRAFYKDFPLCDDEKGDYTKSFMIYNVSPYDGCNVGTYAEDFEDQLTEQGFTEDEIEQVRDYFSHYEYEDWINFWADNVEQSTGLKDQNGKLIYEGDIANSLYRKDGCTGLYVVEWFDGNLGVKKVGEHQQKMVSVSLLDLTRCEVIGNIHRNEELLK